MSERSEPRGGVFEGRRTDILVRTGILGADGPRFGLFVGFWMSLVPIKSGHMIERSERVGKTRPLRAEGP